MAEFEEYLKSKKIDPEKFKAGEPGTWEKFEKLFYQVSPKSFTMQKLFLINQLRRKFHFKEEKETTNQATTAKKRPIIKRKA